MYTARLIFTVIMALVLMSCPPPVSDNPNAPASVVNDSAQNGDNPHDSASVVNDSAQNGDNPHDSASEPNNPDALPQSEATPEPKHYVVQVSAGRNHSMILMENDTLWAVGNNEYGQLGYDSTNDDDGSTTDIVTPVKIMTEVAQVSAGGQHSMILTKDGDLWAVGSNSNGQLGNGNSGDDVVESDPVQVLTAAAGSVLTEVDQVSAGGAHTVILKRNRSVWAVGNNQYGQLGDGSTGDKPNLVQVRISEVPEVDQISAGTYHTMILKKDGTLWAVGLNNFGQLGDGWTDPMANPTQVMERVPGGQPIPMTEVAQVSVGTSHTMILKTNDTLWAVGNNQYGQLGDGSTNGNLDTKQVLNEVAQVSAGGSHSMILKKNDTLWAVGNNQYGQLGNGDETGANQLNPVQVMTEVAQVSAGAYHTMVVKKNGTLWAFGRNNNGQLGDGSIVDKKIPVEITVR